MDLSMLIIFWLGILLVILLAVYFVILYLRPKSILSLVPNEGKLDTTTQIATANQVQKSWYSPSSSTFSVYVYVHPIQRTSSISSNRNITLFNIGSAFEFQLLSPGASNPKSIAQLHIKTSSANGFTDEYIPIKPLPIQDWTLITIVRDARRYTIYFNNESVASGRTTNYPITTTSTLNIGQLGIKGIFAYPQLIPYSINKLDIADYLKKTADTRGKPYLPSESFIPVLPSFTVPSLPPLILPMPDAQWSNININMPNMPQINMPTIPNINMPSMPEIKMPTITFPNLPTISIPSIGGIPNINIPGFPSMPGMPSINMPKLPGLPNIMLPNLPGLPTISLPHFPTMPNITLPNIPALPGFPSINMTPISDIKIPNINLLNINVPNMPDGSWLDLGSINFPPIPSIPGIPSMPNINLQGFPTIPGLPSINMPNISLPNVKFPTIPGLPAIPSINMHIPGIPNFTIPGIPPLPGFPSINMPGIPAINLPGFPQINMPNMPQINMPNMPQINMPSMSWSLCPGIFCFTTNGPPQGNPLQKFTSTYA